MLTKPKYGWTNFKLKGTKKYSLSYLDDIPFEWLRSAIAGLKTYSPFCVHGEMEPGIMTCTICYDYCCISTDEEANMDTEAVEAELSNVGAVDFCKMLCKDIEKYIDHWAYFFCSCREDDESRKEELRELLDTLEELIEKRDY